MSDTEVRSALLKQLDCLPPAEQQQVLRFARSLAEAPRKGVPGERLLRFAGTMTHEEAQEFLRGIDEECERHP
ncbi:MAG: hypothetical protein ABSG86_30330 [Thermoguttaceae bacterium]|jgi:hypothetical protein